MKIERKEDVWKPIIITLDDKEEAMRIWDELNRLYDGQPGSHLYHLLAFLDETFA